MKIKHGSIRWDVLGSVPTLNAMDSVWRISNSAWLDGGSSLIMEWYAVTVDDDYDGAYGFDRAPSGKG